MADLFKLTLDFDGFDLGRGGDRSQRIVFSKLLSKQRGKIIGDHVIQFVGTNKGAAIYRLAATGQDNSF